MLPSPTAFLPSPSCRLCALLQTRGKLLWKPSAWLRKWGGIIDLIHIYIIFFHQKKRNDTKWQAVLLRHFHPGGERTLCRRALSWSSALQAKVTLRKSPSANSVPLQLRTVSVRCPSMAFISFYFVELMSSANRRVTLFLHSSSASSHTLT